MKSGTCVLVTGCAGFIGFHVAKRLLEHQYVVVGADNLNDYYDVALKEARLDQLCRYERFRFHQIGMENTTDVDRIFEESGFDIVIHLAAQAGVRYSLENPYVYLQSNVVGFMNILEACRRFKITHLLYASSSSVYGANVKMPFSVHDNVDHPVSLYAASKKANELMAHTYSHLYGLATTGLRFFTVYGPWGRPDMAYFTFTKSILEGKPIKVFNNGQMKRDFTYIDDVVEAVVRLMHCPPAANPQWDRKAADPGTSYAPYRVFNVGNNQPEGLMTLVHTLEELIGKKAQIEYQPMQQGDVPVTFADIRQLQQTVDFRPSTSIREGLELFVEWYFNHYGIQREEVEKG